MGIRESIAYNACHACLLCKDHHQSTKQNLFFISKPKFPVVKAPLCVIFHSHSFPCRKSPEIQKQLEDFFSCFLSNTSKIDSFNTENMMIQSRVLTFLTLFWSSRLNIRVKSNKKEVKKFALVYNYIQQSTTITIQFLKIYFWIVL